jgi:hypothetical protein
MKFKYLPAVILLLLSQLLVSQNTRLNHHNSIGWYNYFGTFKLSNKIGLHTEYQWRRENIITNWQQSLLRLGFNYNVNPRVLVRLGYALIETFPYGEYPINGLGRDFTEHRIFEMAQLSHKEGIFDFTHRFMLEQRFVGRYSSANVLKEDEFPLLNRARYMIRLQAPLNKKEMKDKTLYLALFDEIFVGFGENVTANVFDQNRIGALLGYRFNKSIRVEVGYINQIIQFGRQINSQSVFQYNSGIVINSNFNLDFTRKSKETK